MGVEAFGEAMGARQSTAPAAEAGGETVPGVGAVGGARQSGTVPGVQPGGGRVVAVGGMILGVGRKAYGGGRDFGEAELSEDDDIDDLFFYMGYTRALHTDTYIGMVHTLYGWYFRIFLFC